MVGGGMGWWGRCPAPMAGVYGECPSSQFTRETGVSSKITYSAGGGTSRNVTGHE